MEEGNRFIRGVVDEATVITTDKGTYNRITVIAPRAVDEETGMINAAEHVFSGSVSERRTCF